MDNPNEPIITEVPNDILKTGHEPDEFKVGGIMLIPITVVVFFVIAFGATTIIFDLFKPKPDPNANPMAKERFSGTLNSRMDRIGIDKEIPQPRLEGMRLRDESVQMNTSSQAIDKDHVNSPEYHPEDLRATGKVAKELGLQSYGKAGDSKTHVAIPISKAISLLAKDKALPVQEKPVDPNIQMSPVKPRGSNAGQGLK